MASKVRGHTRVILSALLGLAFTLAACSPKLGVSGADDGKPIGPTGVTDELQGTWRSNCAESSSIGLGEQAIVQFNGLSIVRSFHLSSRGDCSDEIVQGTWTGTFTPGHESRPSIYELDVQSSSLSVKPLTARGAQLLNLARTCGYTDWQVGVERDVLDRSGSENCFALHPRNAYTVFSIQQGQLYFGEGESFAAITKRPVSVEHGVFLSEVERRGWSSARLL